MLHKRMEEYEEDEPKRVPEVVFDYTFLGSAAAVLMARDRRTQMLFAHVVPRKGLSHVGTAPMYCQHSMGIDGRTLYEGWKSLAMRQATAEFGEKVYYGFNLKGKAKDDKLESRWGGEFPGKVLENRGSDSGEQGWAPESSGVQACGSAQKVGCARSQLDSGSSVGLEPR